MRQVFPRDKKLRLRVVLTCPSVVVRRRSENTGVCAEAPGQRPSLLRRSEQRLVPKLQPWVFVPRPEGGETRAEWGVFQP